MRKNSGFAPEYVFASSFDLADDPYMVSIGAGAVLGNGSLVSGNAITNGKLRIGEVRIGAGATVGANSVVLPGCEIGENALVMGGAMLMTDAKIPAGETWRGNPARKWLLARVKGGAWDLADTADL